MSRPRDQLSEAQKRAIDWIQRGSAKELGALGTQIGQLLAEMVAELADAKAEAKHWKSAFETVRDEFKCAIATLLASGGELGKAADSGRPHLMIRKGDFEKALGLELYTHQPDAHTRIYELREQRPGRTPIDDAVSRIVRPN